MSQSTNPNESSQMTAPASSPAPTGGVPDLMKIGSIPVNTVQEVETAILEPVVRSDTFARFVLPNKGLLHSHSKVEIGLQNAPNDSCIPLGIGAYAFIQRVALKIGNQTICEIDDFNHYYAYRSMFVANENNKEREQMTTGRAISHAIAYKDRTSAVSDGAAVTISGGGESNAFSNGLVLDNGRDADCSGLLIDTTAAYVPNTWQKTQQVDATDINLYQLSLSELCPFLRHNQLPLYMIKEQVALELTFSLPGSTVLSSDRVAVVKGGSASGFYPIDTVSLRMISDHIFYPQELMLQYAQSNSNLNFTYADYRLSKYSVQQADAKTQQIRNVGGAGRIVSKLIWGIQHEGTQSTDANLLNGFTSFAPARDYATGAVGSSTRTNGKTTINIKYNDTFEFPIEVSNPARLFHNVNQTEGMVPFVTREEFSNEGASISKRPFFGYTQDEELQGRFFFLSQRLTSQERINSRGIELYFKYEDLPTAGGTLYTQRVYLEVMRTATIQNGYTECYFA